MKNEETCMNAPLREMKVSKTHLLNSGDWTPAHPHPRPRNQQKIEDEDEDENEDEHHRGIYEMVSTFLILPFSSFANLL
jgi:hypothetical protein